eukprot:6471319-Amphidinium_carterae.2
MHEFESAAIAALWTAPVAAPQCPCTGLVQNWRLPFGSLLRLGASACTDLLLQCARAGAPIEFVSVLLSRFLSSALLASPLSSPASPCAGSPAGLQGALDGFDNTAKACNHRAGRLRRERCFQLKVSSFNARSLLETGKLIYVAKVLAKRNIDILCVQESRFREVLSIPSVEGYRLCSAPASATRGGLLVMIRDRPGLELLEHEVVCPRVLRVALRVNGLLLQLLDAHAPTEEDNQEAHDSFATELGKAVASVCGRGRTLIGVDLNARLLGIESTFVGPLAASSCKHLAIHRRPLIDDLATRGFKAVNTYLGPHDGVTWKHPTGQLYQIDYVCACASAMQIIREVELEEWGIMDLQTTSDHRAVTVTMDWGVKVKTKAAPKSCRRFVSDAHFEDFKRGVISEPPAPWDGSSAPEEYMGQLMSRVHDAVIFSMPKKAPRKPWISERTWNFMLLLNKYRRLQSCLHRNDTTKARDCARAIAFHE